MSSTTATIAGTISANSVQAAPVALAKTVTAVAIAKGAAASASTLTLIKGALKIMAWTKAKTAVVISLTTVLAVSTATVAVKKTRWWPFAANDHLTVAEIVQKAQARYVSLSSYRDEGGIVSTVGGQTITHSFTTMLARTNLFRIAWTENIGVGSVTGMVWSAGEYSFLQMQGAPLQTFSDVRTAISSATGISGGVAATIPGIFFQQTWGNRLGNAARLAKRQADEHIGNMDCYVLTSSNSASTTTLWIGRTDSLIHQIRTITSAAFMNTIMQAMAKKNPNLPALPPSQDVTMIETHSNIAVDTLTPMDFQQLTLTP